MAGRGRCRSAGRRGRVDRCSNAFQQGESSEKKHDHASHAATTRLNSVGFLAPQTKNSNSHRPLTPKLFSKTSVHPMGPVRASGLPALSAENDPGCRWETGEAPWQFKSTAWRGATNLGQSNIGHPTKRAARRDFLRGLGLGAAGAAAFGATSFGRTSALAQQADLDVAILEFAESCSNDRDQLSQAAAGCPLARSPADFNQGERVQTAGAKVERKRVQCAKQGPDRLLSRQRATACF